LQPLVQGELFYTDFGWLRAHVFVTRCRKGTTFEKTVSYSMPNSYQLASPRFQTVLFAIARVLTAVLICVGSIEAFAQSPCEVADPTGTPLNVRASPNGDIVGTLRNGVQVFVLDRSVDRKKQAWVYVGRSEDRSPIGWVYREFIVCAGAPANNQTSCRVTDPTGTPLNIRTTPNGQIVGTLNNGDLVSVLDRTSDRTGKSWVYVGDFEDNKPIGWVYREFIACGLNGATKTQEEGPSFNCTHAKAPDEVLICQNKELAAQDKELARLYSSYMNDSEGGFRAHIQRTQNDWLMRRHACGYNVDCISEAYAVRLGELGDGDIEVYEFCRYHQTDIDCRIQPNDLLQTISAFSWAVGNPVNCGVPEKTYSLQIASGSIVWRSGVGNTDVESINFNGENQAQTITLHSEHRTGRGEPPGTTWSYMKLGPDRIQVTPGGRSSFVLTRCR
jgi:uncharacterized protein